MIIIAYDQQRGIRDLPKVAHGLANKKTHKGAKGGPGRERCISGGQDGKAILDIDRDYDLALHIQKMGRPKVGFHVRQANGGVEGRVESWDGGKRAKGGVGTDGSIDGGTYGVRDGTRIHTPGGQSLKRKKKFMKIKTIQQNTTYKISIS